MILLWPELQFGRLLSYKAGAPAGEIRPRRAAHIGKAIPMTLEKYNISMDQLRQWLSYDSETGEIVWRVKRCGRAQTANAVRKPDPHGYLNITIDRRPYRLHTVAWARDYGEWPPVGMEIDHINLCKTDNRICNLRLASKMRQRGNSGKLPNRSSKYKGVSWEKSRGLWHAAIEFSGHRKFLGRFKDEHEAHLAYCRAADEVFGEFARYG